LSGVTRKTLDLKLGTWSNAKFPAESDELRRVGLGACGRATHWQRGGHLFSRLIKAMTTDDVRSAIKTRAAVEAAVEAVAE
jgi:hypothetical protein